MTVYTRGGDDGSTSGPGGRRVAKSDPGVRVTGDLDELTSHVGLCLAACNDPSHGRIRSDLARIQGQGMAIVGVLSAAEGDEAARSAFVGPATERLERLIDSAEGELGRLNTFILPGGCELACRLHVARTVCRRAERAVAAWATEGRAVPPTVRAYLNRLGDALFVLARLANHAAGVEEVVWSPGQELPPEGADG